MFAKKRCPQNSEVRRQCAYSLRNQLRRLRRGFRNSKKSDSKNVDAVRVNFLRIHVVLKDEGYCQRRRSKINIFLVLATK